MFLKNNPFSTSKLPLANNNQTDDLCHLIFVSNNKDLAQLLNSSCVIAVGFCKKFLHFTKEFRGTTDKL